MPVADQIITDKHKSMIDALRRLESSVLQYVVMLAGALSGLGWLVQNATCDKPAFIIGTLAILFLLQTGAAYCYIVGYNYRCFLLQIAKIEKMFSIKQEDRIVRPYKVDEVVLKAWHHKRIFDKKPSMLWFGPEAINVFWWSFQLATIGVLAAVWYRRDAPRFWALVVLILFVILNVCIACRYSRKLEGVKD